VGRILRDHGIEPAADRGKRSTWTTFLKAHWEALGAADLTTVEVWTCRGLVTYYVLVVVQLSTRRIESAGVTMNADAAWMHQVARNPTDFGDGFLLDTRYLFARPGYEVPTFLFHYRKFGNEGCSTAATKPEP